MFDKIRRKIRKLTYPYRQRREEKTEPSIEEIFETDSPSIRVERWTDGSIFIDSLNGNSSIDFANLNTDNQADAEAWLATALYAVHQIRKGEQS